MAERVNKLVLDNSLITEAFFEGTRLLGIVAPIRGYQFCWHLNNVIGLDFRINELEISVYIKNGSIFFRSMNIANLPDRSSIISTTINSMVNFYSLSLSTSIFYG